MVTGDVNIIVLDDLVQLCLQLAGHGTALHLPAGQTDGPHRPPPRTGPAKTSTASRPLPPRGLDHLTGMSRAAIERAIIGKAADLLSGPGGLA